TRRGRLWRWFTIIPADIFGTIRLWSGAMEAGGHPSLAGRSRKSVDQGRLRHPSAALPANRDERHQTGLRQWVAPAMPRAVLHDAIALAQMDHLSVVQFQRHL